MQAITIIPGKPNFATLNEVAEPLPSDGSVLVKALELGVCGTDFDLIAGEYGWAPANCKHLVLGHESLGTVEEAPAGCGFAKGDLAIGIVRRPDPEPCLACGSGEWDMCRNGRYTERGIKEKHGFGAERWRIEPEFAIKIEPALRNVAILVEPGAVLAKAWEHIAHIGQRANWRPRTLLVTGAGPIGLLAALMGRQRGLAVHVFDQVVSGPKPRLVEQLGAKYHVGRIEDLGFEPDVTIECTGAAPVIRDTLEHLGSAGILCMVGSSAHAGNVSVDVSRLNRYLVLSNGAVFGVVNGNRRHFEMAADSLRRADPSWLAGLITRREPLANWSAAFQRRPDDVKVVIDWTSLPVAAAQ